MLSTFKLDVRLLLAFCGDILADASTTLANLRKSLGVLKLILPLDLAIRALSMSLPGSRAILSLGERVPLQYFKLRSANDLIVGFSHLISS